MADEDLTLTFADDAAPLPDGNGIIGGTYRPTGYAGDNEASA